MRMYGKCPYVANDSKAGARVVVRSAGSRAGKNIGLPSWPLIADSVLSAKERGEVFDGLMIRCRWVEVFYAWRPNLPDEADNHLIELAEAARADAIVRCSALFRSAASSMGLQRATVGQRIDLLARFGVVDR